MLANCTQRIKNVNHGIELTFCLNSAQGQLVEMPSKKYNN